MVPKEIKFVYFDIGGVLIVDFSGNGKWAELLDSLGMSTEEQEKFTTEFKKNVDRLCTGEIDVNALMSRLKDELDLATPVEHDLLMDFVDRFESKPSMYSLVHTVTKKYSVGLLTNMYPGMLDKINEKSLLPDVTWDMVIDSSVVGHAKPYSEIFELAENESGIRSENILFVENTPEHVEIAKSRGWQTFLYDPMNIEKSNKDLELLLS